MATEPLSVDAAKAAGARPIVFRPSDLAAIAIPTLFAILAVAPPGHPDAPHGARLLSVALVAAALRLGPARSRHAFVRHAADLFPIFAVGFGYMWLNPVIDRVSPVLYDGRIAQVEAWLFGAVPSVALQDAYHPALTELLFWCYAAFFAWQLALMGVLWARDDGKRAFESFFTTMVLFYFLSQVMYVLVPVVGPRFALTDRFTVPLEGLWLADALRQSFLDNPMIRDCFPSGHTGLTLMVLGHAWQKRARRFFWIMLPFAVLLIFSTVYCRFHYAVDLICALPFVLAVYAVQRGLERGLPGGVLTVGQAPTPASDRSMAT